MSTLLLPSSETAWPATPAVQPAPELSVPVSADGELSAAVVPLPSSKCQTPEAASAAAAVSSSATPKTRTSSIAPCQKSLGAPGVLAADADQMAGRLPRGGRGSSASMTAAPTHSRSTSTASSSRPSPVPLADLRGRRRCRGGRGAGRVVGDAREGERAVAAALQEEAGDLAA